MAPPGPPLGSEKRVPRRAYSQVQPRIRAYPRIERKRKFLCEEGGKSLLAGVSTRSEKHILPSTAAASPSGSCPSGHVECHISHQSSQNLSEQSVQRLQESWCRNRPYSWFRQTGSWNEDPAMDRSGVGSVITQRRGKNNGSTKTPYLIGKADPP
jgi:hypothetical protein